MTDKKAVVKPEVKAPTAPAKKEVVPAPVDQKALVAKPIEPSSVEMIGEPNVKEPGESNVKMGLRYASNLIHPEWVSVIVDSFVRDFGHTFTPAERFALINNLEQGLNAKLDCAQDR